MRRQNREVPPESEKEASMAGYSGTTEAYEPIFVEGNAQNVRA
jgi:hypothetical protein